MTLGDYEDKETRKINEKLEKWIRISDEHGVETSTFIDGTEMQLGERVLQAAKDLNSELIVMPTFSSKIDAVVIGSRALDVVRNSHIPVLIQYSSE